MFIRFIKTSKVFLRLQPTSDFTRQTPETDSVSTCHYRRKQWSYRGTVCGHICTYWKRGKRELEMRREGKGNQTEKENSNRGRGNRDQIPNGQKKG